MKNILKITFQLIIVEKINSGEFIEIKIPEDGKAPTFTIRENDSSEVGVVVPTKDFTIELKAGAEILTDEKGNLVHVEGGNKVVLDGKYGEEISESNPNDDIPNVNLNAMISDLLPAIDSSQSQNAPGK